MENNIATVLMPNFNCAEYLTECLDSIKNQTFKNFNLIIIDDCSTDNSCSIIENYKGLDIQLIKKTENSGIEDSLNIGLNEIQSKYIIRMDSDDLMHKSRIEKLIQFMESHSEIGVCGSAIQHFGISDEIIKFENSPLENKANLIFIHSVGHASTIIRNSILKENEIKYSKGYKYLEDYKFFYDLSKHTLIYSLKDALYYYRREAYNNYQNRDIRKLGFRKMYSSILSELKMDSSEKSINIHYEIGHYSHKMNFDVKEYINHFKNLIRANNQHNVFPVKEFNNCLNSYINKMFYKLHDHGKIKISNLFYFFIRNPKIIFYYFSKTI